MTTKRATLLFRKKGSDDASIKSANNKAERSNPYKILMLYCGFCFAIYVWYILAKELLGSQAGGQKKKRKKARKMEKKKKTINCKIIKAKYDIRD